MSTRTVRIAMVAVLVASAASAAHAQGGVLLQGLADVEFWSTNATSLLLTRNSGHPGAVERVQLWSAVEPWRGVFVFAQGHVEAGSARQFGQHNVETDVDQAGLRVTRNPRLVLNVGKMYNPFGTFASRNFSSRNPLIGAPDGYPVTYPVGGTVSGEMSRFDYRAGVVSLPETHRGYVPPADDAAHPVIGAGLTPWVGTRIGVSATMGPYLNKGLTASQTAGRSWRAYDQRLVAADLETGAGHYDLRAEFAYGSYDVPTLPAISGQTGYMEGRYTVSPRVFVAARGEVNDYPFIAPTSPTTWTAQRVTTSNWEVGAGYRVSTSTLIKASYRRDYPDASSQNGGYAPPSGRALALQLSQGFDVADLARIR